MANGSGRMMSEEASVNIGALQQRVYGLEQAVSNISNQLTSIAQQIASGGKTNWSVLIATAGFCLLFAGAVGGLAYAPIRESQTDLKLAVSEANKALTALANQTAFQINSISKEFISVREHEQRATRVREDITRLNSDLTSQEVNMRRSMEQADANLQRQIDDQKKAFGDTFSLRDALQQMRREIDDLKRRPTS
jgi:hypothetical protein